MTNLPAIKISLSEIVEEYMQKSMNGEKALADYSKAIDTLRLSASVKGTHSGARTLVTGTVYPREFADTLLKSAWRTVYDGLFIDQIATATDKKRLMTFLANPPEFTMGNIRDHFGDFTLDQRQHILRGLAECFVNLDDAYKSHSKVRVGVKGLPKRIIVGYCDEYQRGGKDTITDVINAINRCEGLPPITFVELEMLFKNARNGNVSQYRDMKMKIYAKGTGHLSFGPDSLLTINRALSEFYGAVLPDSPDENAQMNTGTSVSKDLAFYPTPKAVLDRLFTHKVELRSGMTVLEPSCGEGVILERIVKTGAQVIGVEVDPRRAAMCSEKGYNVMTANFLETEPYYQVDYVVMNPPFCGRHYLKHINKAIAWLKPGGTLVAILPATAWYDHKALPDSPLRAREVWEDLPVGSFASSGTNVPTGIWTFIK